MSETELEKEVGGDPGKQKLSQNQGNVRRHSGLLTEQTIKNLGWRGIWSGGGKGNM